MSLTVLISIPELALLLAEDLDGRDYYRLCLTCKTLMQVFQPLIWREYEYDDYEPPHPFLAKNLVHLRNLSITINDPLSYRRPLGAKPLAIYDFIVGPTAQDGITETEAINRMVSFDGHIDDDSNSDDCNQNKPCTTLQQFQLQLQFSEYGWDADMDFQSMVEKFILRVVHLYTHLAEISLNSRLVLTFDGDLLKALLSLTRLRSLEISMDEVYESTQPTALNMAIELGHRHSSLESILFGGWTGGWRPCIAFRPDHMTEEDELELDRRDEDHDIEEQNFLMTTE